MAPPPRVRRPPDEARRLILDAAERLLAEGGVAAVQVRAVAARVNMTDAGVYHHFGTRDQLMEALLRHGGRRLQAGIAQVLDSWRGDLHELVEALAAFYREGYGELAVALHTAGWRDNGSGMLNPVVDALHTTRPAGTPIEDTQLAVAALHQALALESRYGPAFRRSAGLTKDVSVTQWWTDHLTRSLTVGADPRGYHAPMADGTDPATPPQDTGAPDSVETDPAALTAAEDLDEDRLELDPLEEGMDPPERWSAANRYGTTPYEQEHPRGFGQRLAEEEPDTPPAPTDPEPDPQRSNDEATGRMAETIRTPVETEEVELTENAD